MKRMKLAGVMFLAAVAVVGAQGQPASSDGDAEVESASAGSATIPADVSPGVGQVIKLAEAGSSDDVILAYVQNSEYPFNVTADVVIYLKDLGLSSPVVSAMLNHDATLRSQPQKYVYDQKYYGPSTPPPPDTAATQFAPATTQAPPPVEQPVAVAAPPEPPPTAPPVVEVSTPPPQVSYFYDDLSPYGTWVELDGVGWCWQPSTLVVNHAWQPYCDGGHWVDSDAGWYWQSDYSWGWAPFHYGRWYRHARCGWVWVPDTVWAPAWVTWRSVDDRCGWAPLPPHADFDARIGFRFNGVAVRADFDFGLLPVCFTFIALRDFGEHDYRRHCLPPTEVNVVFRRTVVVNNYVVNNTIIVNRGIPIEHVREVSHAEFKHMAVRDLPAGGARVAEARGQAAVYRHELKAPEHHENFVAQRVDAAHPVVQHAEVRSLAVEHKPITRVNTPATTVPRPGGGFEPNRPRPATEFTQPKTPVAPKPSFQRPEEVKQPAVPNTPKPAFQQPNDHRPATGFENRQPVVTPPTKPHTEEVKQPVAPITPKPVFQQPNEPRSPTGFENRQPVAPNLSKPVTPHPEEVRQPAAPAMPKPPFQRVETPKPPTGQDIHQPVAPTVSRPVTPQVTQPQQTFHPDSGVRAMPNHPATPAPTVTAPTSPYSPKGNNLNQSHNLPAVRQAQPGPAPQPAPGSKQQDNGQSDKKKNNGS